MSKRESEVTISYSPAKVAAPAGMLFSDDKISLASIVTGSSYSRPQHCRNEEFSNASFGMYTQTYETGSVHDKAPFYR